MFVDPVLIPIDGYQWVVRQFDGATRLGEIQARVLRETGQLISTARLEELVEQLDRALVLDGPTFAAYHESYRRAPVRPAALAGRSYAGTERALQAPAPPLLLGRPGSGLPQPETRAESSRLRGVLSPHIDFQRGGLVYTWSLQGTCRTVGCRHVRHPGCSAPVLPESIRLDSQGFRDPTRACPDRPRVRRSDRCPGRLRSCSTTSSPIEPSTRSSSRSSSSSTCWAGARLLDCADPGRVVSRPDGRGDDPIEADDVRRFVEALRAAEAANGRKVAYIGGIDLCHVGPEFGDPDLLNPETLAEVRSFDTAMLDRAAAMMPRAGLARRPRSAIAGSVRPGGRLHDASRHGNTREHAARVRPGRR